MASPENPNAFMNQQQRKQVERWRCSLILPILEWHGNLHVVVENSQECARISCLPLILSNIVSEDTSHCIRADHFTEKCNDSGPLSIHNRWDQTRNCR
uniref:Uncharacterized protein n=1 Tax=Ascaris lumbricoides TaxID=6252 RepID=A0A0M3HXY3_ASCLU